MSDQLYASTALNYGEDPSLISIGYEAG